VGHWINKEATRAASEGTNGKEKVKRTEKDKGREILDKETYTCQWIK
jgi:hypothetical protein